MNYKKMFLILLYRCSNHINGISTFNVKTQQYVCIMNTFVSLHNKPDFDR